MTSARTCLLMLVACAGITAEALALTIHLDRQRVPTTIDGVQVDLFVTGPVDAEFGGGKVQISIDGTLDLSDLQKHFASIARARAVNVRCGDSVTLEGATIRPVRLGAETVAEVRSDATFRRSQCAADGVTVARQNVTRGRLVVQLRVRADEQARLVFAITIGDQTARDVADLLAQASMRTLVTTMLTGSLGAAIGSAAVAAPLSPEAAKYEPKVTASAFRPLGGDALGAHLVVTLTVPLDTFFAWKIGE